MTLIVSLARRPRAQGRKERMTSILADMTMPDRVSKRRAKVRLNFETIAREAAESIDSRFGPEAKAKQVATLLEESAEEAKGSVCRLATARSEKQRERDEITAKAHLAVSEAVASVVLEAVPLDGDAKAEFGGKIRANVSRFVNGLLEDGTIKVSDFSRNSSPVVRDFVHNVLAEEGKEDASGSKIAAIVMDKAKQAIKAEIRVAQERQAMVEELSQAERDEAAKAEGGNSDGDGKGESEPAEGAAPKSKTNEEVDVPEVVDVPSSADMTDVGDMDDVGDEGCEEGKDKGKKSCKDKGKKSCKEGEGKIEEELGSLNLYRTNKEKVGSSLFSRLMKESARRILKERGVMDPDRATGEAAVSFCVIETLNTMNLLKDPEAIVSRLSA